MPWVRNPNPALRPELTDAEYAAGVARRARAAARAASQAEWTALTASPPIQVIVGPSGLRYQLRRGGDFIREGDALHRLGIAAPQILSQIQRAQVLAGNIARQVRLTMPMGRVYSGFGKVIIRYMFRKDTSTTQGFTRQGVDRIGNDIASFMKAHMAETSARGKDPSDPYDYPHTLTGTLLRSIGRSISSSNNFWQLDVGTVNGPYYPYFGYLEQGTMRMAPRPFAHRTKDEFSLGEAAFDAGAYETGYQGRREATVTRRNLATLFGGDE